MLIWTTHYKAIGAQKKDNLYCLHQAWAIDFEAFEGCSNTMYITYKPMLFCIYLLTNMYIYIYISHITSYNYVNANGRNQILGQETHCILSVIDFRNRLSFLCFPCAFIKRHISNLYITCVFVLGNHGLSSTYHGFEGGLGGSGQAWISHG